MKIAIIGASGKTGTKLVHESMRRGHQAVAVCRDSSADKLRELAGLDGFTLLTAPVVSDESTLTQALAGCDAVIAILLTVRRLRATDLVTSLGKAAAVRGVTRFIFTAGEVTAVREAGETFTLRQRVLQLLGHAISRLTVYSVPDMVQASVLVREQTDWEWTIMRAPTLRETAPVGYRLCPLAEVTSAHELSRQDYAACLLDSIATPDHHGRVLTVVPAATS